MPEKTEAQKKAQKKYMEKFMVARVRMEREKYERVQAHAETQGESVNGFINRAIDRQISQDREKGPCEAQQAGGISLHPKPSKRPRTPHKWPGRRFPNLSSGRLRHRRSGMRLP